MKRDAAYVYVVGWRVDGPTKIGVAQHVPHRMESLQNGCPYQLQAFAMFWCLNAYVLEAAVLKDMSPDALVGEWVDIPAAAVARRVGEVAKRIGLHIEKRLPRKSFNRTVIRQIRRREHAAMAELRHLRNA